MSFRVLLRRSGSKLPCHVRYNSTSIGQYQHILESRPLPGVALITLNRPKQLNALCSPLMEELGAALSAYQADDSIGAVVLTGSEKSFAAGADIKEMQDKTYATVTASDFLSTWSSSILSFRKPLLGAVNGFALGGGCELAMACDVLYAGDAATFGQPEIKLGVIPGAGGSQRLLRAAGKSNAMEIILTGKNFSAQEALQWGVVTRVFPATTLVDETCKTAAKIASYGRLSVQAAKEAVNVAEELSLANGLQYERRLFHGLFATKDQKEGMGAFVEKRKAKFTHE